MRVKIGPYVDFIGPYQIAESLRVWNRVPDTFKKLGINLDLLRYTESAEDRVVAFLVKCKIDVLANWIHSMRSRTVKVRIDKFDAWNAYETLSLIILPLLKEVKKDKHGSPMVDDEDVPEGMNLRSTEAPPKKDEWDTDDNLFARWDWVLDEMIWTFEQLQPDLDWESQYESGVVDIKFVPMENKPGFSEMVRGPNDTYKADYVAIGNHRKRIDNGLRLFGKYFQSLWT